MEKLYLTWNDIENAVEKLAVDITNSKIEIAAVGGLPRGGLIPAVLLSHKMNIPFVSQANVKLIPGNILIVDDICDTGKTLKPFKFESNVYTAAIYHKISAMVEPNFWFKLANEDEWIVYPWEQKDSQTIPDYATERK